MTMDLRDFLDDLQERLPYDFVRIERTVAPHQFEVTALLQHLENQKKFPVLFFEKPLDLNGKPSAFPLLSNVFATRQRCALSLGMKPNESELPLSLEYARREDRLLPPVTIPAKEAPVKEIIKRGDEAIFTTSPWSAPRHGSGAVHRHDAGDGSPTKAFTISPSSATW
jgi:UbiD family decarboxylase